MGNLSSRPEGLRLTAIGLNQHVRADLNLLQDISLCIQPNEFVVIVGQSGGGKSTLLDALSGYRPASQGQVFANHARPAAPAQKTQTPFRLYGEQSQR